MKKLLNKTSMLVALLFALIACLVGATTLSLTAHAQEEEPTSTVEFTSYTSVLQVGERFTFSAIVTDESGAESTSVTWSSSDAATVTIAANGLALARAEGNATITATAADGASASVNVLVSNSAVRVESIEVYPSVLVLGEHWKTRLSYTILPTDAYEQRATWASSNPDVVSVDANGNVEALTAGTATITVTSIDNQKTATCAVEVKADLKEATLTPATLVTMIGQVENNTMELSLPDGVTASNYRWYSMDDSIASIDPHADATGSIFSWNFGTTTIYAVADGSDGEVYAAEGTVHVTAEFYYLTGLEEILEDPTDPNVTPWVTYDTEAEAQAAGVLLVQDADNPYVYSLTRSLWANDNFQIIHNDMDIDWTTRITSRAFNEEGSSMPYIANDAETFAVNALGTYTITLDLSDGRAQVTIEMVSLKVTSFDLSVAEGSKSYLQYNCAETGAEADAARTMELDVYTIPETAVINPADVSITTNPSVSDHVRIAYKVIASSIVGQEGLPVYSMEITLTLLEAYETTTTFQLIVEIDNKIANLPNPTDDVTITILPDGTTYAPVSTVTFTNTEGYLVNVNNGATEWISSTPIEAMVNADASVQGVVYSELSDHIFIEYREVENEAGEMELKPFVHADALGTYTIYATSLGTDADGNTVTAETTVLVTSLVGTEPNYSTGFYLIGILDGVVVENWTSIVPEEQNFDGSDFADWQLPLTSEEAPYVTYSGDFHFMVDDRFSIAFLGMDGNWGGIINESYFDWANSTGNFYESNANVQITVSGSYNVSLELGNGAPSWKITLVEPDDKNLEYRIYYYVVRSGDAWNGALSEEENVLGQIGYIDMLDGVAQGSFVYTLNEENEKLSVDFYSFYKDTNEWPTFQIVSAIARNYKEQDTEGIVGGYFQEPVWYGSGYDVSRGEDEAPFFSGDAYSATEEDHFTNYNAELYWVSSVLGEIPETMEGKMTVTFSITVDNSGVLTGVEINFVTSQEVPAE